MVKAQPPVFKFYSLYMCGYRGDLKFPTCFTALNPTLQSKHHQKPPETPTANTHQTHHISPRCQRRICKCSALGRLLLFGWTVPELPEEKKREEPVMSCSDTSYKGEIQLLLTQLHTGVPNLAGTLSGTFLHPPLLILPPKTLPYHLHWTLLPALSAIQAFCWWWQGSLLSLSLSQWLLFNDACQRKKKKFYLRKQKFLLPGLNWM